MSTDKHDTRESIARAFQANVFRFSRQSAMSESLSPMYQCADAIDRAMDGLLYDFMSSTNTILVAVGDAVYPVVLDDLFGALRSGIVGNDHYNSVWNYVHGRMFDLGFQRVSHWKAP